MIATKKRSLSLILTLMMILAFALSASAAPVKNSAGYYELATSDDMVWFQQQVAEGNTGINAMLTADIDLSDTAWKPIWSSEAYEANPVSLDVDNYDTYAYQGVFDGKGYKITIDLDNSNLQDSYTEILSGDFDAVTGVRPRVLAPEIGTGLFYVIGKSAVVKNFTVTGNISIADTISSDYQSLNVGGVAVKHLGVIYNVHAKNMKLHTASQIEGFMGAISAMNMGARKPGDAVSVIDGSSAEGIEITSKRRGGIAAGFISGNTSFHAKIKNSNASDSTGVFLVTANAGGISGSLARGGGISNCTVSDIAFSTEVGSAVDIMSVGALSFGGIVGVGWAELDTTNPDMILADGYYAIIENCVADKVTLTAKPQYALDEAYQVSIGGIAGFFQGIDAGGVLYPVVIRNCQVLSPTLTGEAQTLSVGGVLGHVRGPLVIDGCVVEDLDAVVSDKENSTAGNGIISVGGILGRNANNDRGEDRLVSVQLTNNVVRDLDVEANLSNEIDGNQTSLRVGGIAGTLSVGANNYTGDDPILLFNNAVDGENSIDITNERDNTTNKNDIQVGGLAGLSYGTATISENTVSGIDYDPNGYGGDATWREGNLVGMVDANIAAQPFELTDNSYSDESVTGTNDGSKDIGYKIGNQIGNADISGNSSYDSTLDPSQIDTDFVILEGLTDPITLEPGQSITVSPQGYAGTKQFDVLLLSSDPNVLSVVDNGDGTYTITAVGTGSASVKGYYVTKDGVTPLDISVTVAAKGAYTSDTVVPETSGGDPNDIYEGEDVDIIVDFGTGYEVLGVDDSGLFGSGLVANLVDGKVQLSGKAETPGSYYYVVTLKDLATGEIFDQTMPVVINGGSRPTSRSSGSSNCNSGVGSALFALMGLAFVYRRK